MTAARRKPTRTLEPDGGRLKPVEAAEAEATAEVDDDGSVQVGLAGEQIKIKPAGQWRSSAMTALSNGQFDQWAETSLADDKSWETWQRIDPTLSAVEDMLQEWRVATGQDPGESRASRRSSRRTARR